MARLGLKAFALTLAAAISPAAAQERAAQPTPSPSWKGNDATLVDLMKKAQAIAKSPIIIQIPVNPGPGGCQLGCTKCCNAGVLPPPKPTPTPSSGFAATTSPPLRGQNSTKLDISKFVVPYKVASAASDGVCRKPELNQSLVSELSGYIDSPVWMKCGRQAARLQALVTEFVAGHQTDADAALVRRVNFNQLLPTLDESQRKLFYDVIAEYDRYCLAGRDDLNTTKQAMMDEVLDRLIVFAHEQEGVGVVPYCHGYGYGDRILTARHCLTPRQPQRVAFDVVAEGGTKTVVGVSLENWVDAGTKIYALKNGEKVEIKAELDISAGPSIYSGRSVFADDDLDLRSHDWAVLKITNGPNFPKIGLLQTIDSPRDFSDRLFVVGINANAIWAEAFAFPDWDGRTLNWSIVMNALRVDFSAACRTFMFRRDMFFHMCQTEKGLSGAPIFLVKDDKLHLVGVQSGFAHANEHCDTDLGKLAPNIGLHDPIRWLTTNQN